MRVISILILAFAAFALLVGSMAVAAKGDDKADGRELYIEYCKTCHGAGSRYGEYTPMSLIQEQWETFFEERLTVTHSDLLVKSDGGEAKLLDILTKKQMKAIRKFAVDHAADSEQPMSCDEPPGR